MVRSPAFANVSAQEPEGAVLVQLSPVLAWTVTVPLGTSDTPACAAPVNATVTGCPAIAGFGDTLAIDAVLAALVAVPVSGTCCVAPLAPPLSSVKVRVPVAAPAVNGANFRLSTQLAPGAIGDAANSSALR